MKYIIYARRSSEDKSKQVQSIPDQLSWAKERAAERGLTVSHIFQDIKTGTKPGREQFGEMIELINGSPEPFGIICWKIDRLARNPVDEGMIKFAFMQNKIKHILSKDREFREGENQILMGVEFGAATQYSIELSRNVKRGMKSKVTKGWKPGLVPLGYLNDPYGIKGEKEIHPDPERFDHIKRMWDMLLDGIYSVPQILDKANEEWGLRDKHGKKLSRSTAYSIFNNPFYAGMFRWSDELHAGSHTKMISLEDFEKGQAILGKKGKACLQVHKHKYTGLIQCGECGCMITAEPPKRKVNKKNGNVHVYHYMHCTKKRKAAKCQQKCIRLEELEGQIEAIIDSLEISPAFEEWIFKQIKELNKDAEKEFVARRRKLQREYNENESMIDNLTDQAVRKVVSEENYKIHIKRYELRRTHLKQELEDYEDKKDDWLDKMLDTFQVAKEARTSFANGDRETRQKILRRIGSNFLLKDRVLIVETKNQFKAVQKGVAQERAILHRLEPDENGLYKTKDLPLEALIPVWSE